jgi:ATP-dependent helicase HrpB
MKPRPLPIDAVLPEVIAALNQHGRVVIQAPTGAGKTTRVPPAVLDAGLTGSKHIVMLEPRRLAARAAARRMTDERGGRLGEEIGYQVRFDKKFGPHTRILVVTEGILVRMLQDDPFLENVGVVIFDEFHERSLDNDLALAMVRRVQQTVRPELRIVVMSATLDVDKVSAYLDHCPVIASEGRQFPVDIVYEPKALQEPWPVAAARAVERLLDRTSGDVLVFLPGLFEIKQTARHLEALAQERNLAVLPLYGDLPAEQQDAALLPLDRRKIVLATNVAETSVTVEGITGVVDTGLARLMGFDARIGLDRLRLTPISRSSADQRAGRAGRTGPGVCVRLWSEASQRSRPEQTEPEIRRVDLAGAILQLLCWGEKDIAKFPWLEPPPESTVQHGLALLRLLGAVANGGVTDLGRLLARLPMHPRLGRLLIEGQRFGHADQAALAAALLAERDPFIRSLDSPPEVCRHVTPSDVLDRMDALEEFARRGQTTMPVNRNAARFVLRARDQLWKQVSNLLEPTNRQVDKVPPREAMLRSLLAAFPDRVARRRKPGSRKGLMVGGRGVRLAPQSGVTEPELFLCIDADAGKTETLVRQASLIERAWLPAEHIKISTQVSFNPDTEGVTARRRISYLDLLLEESPAAFPDEAEVARVLAEAASANLDKVRPPADSPAGRFLLRVRCLCQWMPELDLPEFSDNDLRDVLPWLCPGCRSFADLRKASWFDVLQNKLTVQQRHLVEREAPERIQVPSGSRIALTYEEGRPPILAVRIQELFGLADTPRIAGGRVRVLMHLLAPNQRPQQITDDLASFWKNTYQQVRKGLRARYPKHAWPLDPWSAPAEHRPKRKRPEKS